MGTDHHDFDAWVLAVFRPGTYWRIESEELPRPLLLHVLDRRGPAVRYDLLQTNGTIRENTREITAGSTIASRVTEIDETEWLCACLLR